jgi:very-short-patch-repair endonuclease
MRREIRKLFAPRTRSGSRAREIDARPVDAAIAELASGRRGLVSRDQLLALDMSPSAITRRLATGRLHEIHQGVYAVGHRAITREAELLAAVMAGGGDSVLAHASAAELWGLPLELERDIHVISATSESRPGIVFHRNALSPEEVTTHKNIRVTTPERTIVDVANGLSVAQLEHLIRQARYEHLVSNASLATVADAHRGARGMRNLRRALDLSAESGGVSRSNLERRFLRFIRRYGLPRPELNYRIELPQRTVYADCAWPRQRLIVELDSRMAHHNEFAFEADRARDRDLLIAGWRTTRVTWRHLDAGEQLANDLRALLAEIRIDAA